MKSKRFSVTVNGQFIKNISATPCAVCGGHPPVTKKAADGECLEHVGLRECIKTLEATNG